LLFPVKTAPPGDSGVAEIRRGKPSVNLIHEAERKLRLAAAPGTAGRFQLEPAIQSVHSHRAVTGRTEWEAIALFYDLVTPATATSPQF
jgi:predicted RNA polymerase sigma factor